MAQKRLRTFGEMPEAAKTGPISLRNYHYRAEAHCAAHSSSRNGVHPTIRTATDGSRLWREYFERHLGGLPLAMKMLLSGAMQEMSVPEINPTWFDPSFEPSPDYVEPPYLPAPSPARAWPEIPEGQDYYSMVAKYGPPVGRVGQNRPALADPPRRQAASRFTADDLRAIYARHDAAAAEVA